MDIHLKDIEEFEALFEKDNPEITLGIFSGIKEAFEQGEEEADLFTITFENAEDYYELSLEYTQWAQALDKCLEKFEGFEMVDEAIDTYQLRKKFYEKYGPIQDS